MAQIEVVTEVFFMLTAQEMFVEKNYNLIKKERMVFMKAANEYVELMRELNFKIDDIEKMVKLLLVNDLIENAEEVFVRDEELEPAVTKVVESCGMKIGKCKKISGIMTIDIIVPRIENVSIKNIMRVNRLLKEKYPFYEPLFVYENINGMQRKRIIQENISFCVKNKEVHITASGRRNK